MCVCVSGRQKQKDLNLYLKDVWYGSNQRDVETKATKTHLYILCHTVGVLFMFLYISKLNILERVLVV